MRISMFLVCLVLPSLALAEKPNQNAYLAGYAGVFDIAQGDDEAIQLGAEYRYRPIYNGLRPAVGASITADGSVYGYGGLFWDLMLDDRWIVTPNFSAGLYHQGSGRDLGHAIEFRSGIELSYQLDEGERLGLHFNHMSNAGIGDDNPGAETLLLVYQHPLN